MSLVDKSAYADVAAGFEQAVAETLAIKCRRALEHTRMERLVVAGGVSANLRLRAELDKRIPGRVYYPRSEEHTSELQSRGHLVCRLLLEKKKQTTYSTQ